MAETKITQLTSITTPYVTDIYPIVTDPTGAPATNKVQGLHLLNPWLRFRETCTYASATSFTIPGNYSTYFTLGTKVRLYNNSTKYGYVLSSSYSSPNTTVNLVENTTFSLVDTGVSNVCISYANPYDFPGYFSYDMQWTTSGTQPSLGNGTIDAKMKISDRNMSIYFSMTFGSSTTFGTGTYFLSIPINPTLSILGTWKANRPSTVNYTGAIGYGASGKLSMTVNGATYITNSSPLTWASGDSITGGWVYPI